MPRLDRATRTFWRTVGRPVDLGGAERWLDAPVHDGATIGDHWLEAEAARLGGTLVEDPAAGLIPDLAALDGPAFRARDLAPEVRDFYEHTAGWRMEVWTQWNTLFQPGGELVSRYFGRRVHQLALPTQPLDVAHGMDSRVVAILDPFGQQQAAGWLRTLRSSGGYVYSGCYSSRTLPGSRQPSVHVAFPLEAGNVQVFLRPAVLPGGGLELRSPAGGFGQDGAYVLVGDGGRAGSGPQDSARDSTQDAARVGRPYAARVPIHEHFRVYVDDEGVLRTDHLLQLWSATVLRLHYKLTPTSA